RKLLPSPPARLSRSCVTRFMSPYLVAGLTSCADAAPAIHSASAPGAATAAIFAKRNMKTSPSWPVFGKFCGCQATQGWAGARGVSSSRHVAIDGVAPKCSAGGDGLFAAVIVEAALGL